jgi:hypothetical protein
MHQVSDDHVENARTFHKTLNGIKINKNSFEGILMTLTVLSKIMEIIVKSYSLTRVLNRLLNFISERGRRSFK